MGAFSRRSLGSVVAPRFLFDANFELTPLEPGPAASSRRGLQWRPRPAGGTLRGRPTPRFGTISNSLLACKPVTMKHSDALRLNNTWRFDAQIARREIVFRRIGRNEQGAIQVCLLYVNAQREYAKKGFAGEGVYAQRL